MTLQERTQTKSVFKTDDGVDLPVSERFLFSALSPTSPGTNYWEPPPPGELTDRQRARILLQCHQIVDMFRAVGADLNGKRLVDIGTGNGFVPRLLLDLTGLAEAVGADPFLDGEHKTSWQPHDHDRELADLRGFIDRTFGQRLDFSGYAKFLSHENFTMRPAAVDLPARTSKRYRFWQVGAHEMDRLDEGTFDFAYCKAIEHIPDWAGVFRAARGALGPNGLFYLKHRSFFSYLGAHRYASTLIPWGHVLMTDAEFRRYAQEFHRDRMDEMNEFFFSGLSYPRLSVPDMVRIALSEGFEPVLVAAEPPRYLSKVAPLIGDIPDFWKIVRKNYPSVGADEILSGMHHVILRKAA